MPNDDTDAGAETGDDLPAPAPVPSRPIASMTPRERAEELFDVVLELFNRCFTLCGWAGEVADDYLRIEHTIQSVGPDGYDFDPRFFLMELVMNTMSNWKAFDAWIARAKELLPTLRDELNAASSGPVKIGPVFGSTAHEAAIVLCDHEEVVLGARHRTVAVEALVGRAVQGGTTLSGLASMAKGSTAIPVAAVGSRGRRGLPRKL